MCTSFSVTCDSYLHNICLFPTSDYHWKQQNQDSSQACMILQQPSSKCGGSFPKGRQRPSEATYRQIFKGTNFHALKLPLYYSCLYLRPHTRMKSPVFLLSPPLSECPVNDLKQIKTHLLSIPSLRWYIIVKHETSGVPNSRQYKLPSL